MFCAEVKRKQRRADGTLSLEGCRFEVPNQYRHLDVLHVRYVRWDLRSAYLVDPQSNLYLTALYPQDKSANANSIRRALHRTENKIEHEVPTVGIAPLLKELMSQYAATGLPPAYLPKENKK
jgi:hypothetical protein